MTILPDLEQRLIELATRAAPPKPRRRRWPSVPGAMVTTFAATIGLAIVAVAISTLGHRSQTPARPPSAAVPPAARALVSELAVLRRRQTPADLNSANLNRFLQVHGPDDPRQRLGQPIRSLIRLATVTPWGEKVYLVPFLAPDGMATLGLVANGGSCCVTAAGIASNGLGGLSGSGGPAGGPSRNQVVVVVPDGVAKVAILLPRQGIAGEPAYKHTLAITVPVHNNVAAFQSTRYADDIGLNHMIWYGPTGNIVRRIGNNSNLNRVTRPPKPSSPTALSLRAEANPATPNPVWVTPRTGGPHTTFTISFRLLINGAAYQYLFSGPGGPGCRGKTPTRGGGGIGGGPDDVRGQIWSEPFQPSSGAGPSVTAWCPGTFHVSVSAFAVPGRSGRSYPPFGTATFIVKP
jgi:hypothetical protein